MTVLPIVWASIIAFCIVMYVILDGFTLGTGMLMGLTADTQERDVMISVVLPTWDGNQTWLVLGGASLYGAFPLAFSTILPHFYLALFCMVLALLLRGVIFEFRLKSQAHKKFWDPIFIAACLIVPFIQGTILGNYVQGFVFTDGNTHDIGASHFLNGFAIFAGICLILGYALLGTTRLIYKTSGKLQEKMYRLAPWLATAVLIGLGLISLSMLYVHPQVKERWFDPKIITWMMLPPSIMTIAYLALLRAVIKRYEYLPYAMTVLIFLCGFSGLAISLYPFLVPYQISVWEAAAPSNTLSFILVGAIIMLPVLLAYTGFSYRIFRGKVNESIHY